MTIKFIIKRGAKHYENVRESEKAETAGDAGYGNAPGRKNKTPHFIGHKCYFVCSGNFYNKSAESEVLNVNRK